MATLSLSTPQCAVCSPVFGSFVSISPACSQANIPILVVNIILKYLDQNDGQQLPENQLLAHFGTI